MNDKYYIPKTLDEPFRIYLLSIDEFIILVAPLLIIGFVLHQMIFGFVVGIGSLMLLKYVKGEEGHFYLQKLAYWYFPQFIKFRLTPPSYVRDYLG